MRKPLACRYREGRSSDIRAGAVQKCYDTPLGVSIEKDREKSHKRKMFSFSQARQWFGKLPPDAGYLIEYKPIVRPSASILGFTKRYQNVTLEGKGDCTFVTTAPAVVSSRGILPECPGTPGRVAWGGAGRFSLATLDPKMLPLPGQLQDEGRV
jgi:hypothetical protein